MKAKIAIRIVSLICLLVSLNTIHAHEVPVDSVDLFMMDLEELMEVRIGLSSITSLDYGNDPASITIITAQDIRVTPARTLLDLLEVYVPGETYVNHYRGSRFGMRGILGDQNYSFLLLVNGVNMNMVSSDGPLYEINNKDLNDIERIEIVRGPGSVTYGPGAIGGVINIITKDGSDAHGFKVSTEYNPTYRYNNLFLSYSRPIAKGQLYLNGSISRSLGLDDTKLFYVDRAHGYGYGFMGYDWGYQGLGTPVADVMEDYFDHPELKFNLNYKINEIWKFWSRLSTFNQTEHVQERTVLDGHVFSGEYGASLLSVLENKMMINKKMRLTSQGHFSSKSIRELAFYNGSEKSNDHVTQRSASYSENIIGFKNICNYYPSEKVEIAAGGGIDYQYYGPEWGLDRSEFVMGFQAPIRFAVFEESSEFYKTFPTYSTLMNGAIDGYMVNLFSEVNWKAMKKTTLLFSTRVDKHVYSDWAISPRLAVLNKIEEKHFIKVLWQRSVRLPNFSDMFSGDKINHKASKPEVLEGIELIYSRELIPDFSIQVSSFYQTVDQIAWRGDLNHADEIGNFDLLGAEIELSYVDDKIKAGLNFSQIKQLDWNPVFKDEAYITHTDGTITYLVDTGENRINNLPESTIKAYYNRHLPYNLSIHLDGRFYWNYGQEEMLEMFLNAHIEDGTPETQSEMQAIYDQMIDEGYSRPSFTSNASISWDREYNNIDVGVDIYAMNLIAVNHIRYIIQYWETGNVYQYPRQCGFIKEPLTVGIKLNIKF